MGPPGLPLSSLKTLLCCVLRLAAAAAQAGDSLPEETDEHCLEITQIQSRVSLPSPDPGYYGHLAQHNSLMSGRLLMQLSGKESTCQCWRCGFDPLGWEDPLEKEMATHSSFLAWEIPWAEEPGGLQSVG